MRMREKLIRGKQYQWKDKPVVGLEGQNEIAKVLLDGKLMTCPKNELNLNIIDTIDYEKISSDAS